jgi:hypothetical protein
MILNGIDVDDNLHLKAVDKLAHFGFTIILISRASKNRIMYTFRCSSGHLHWCYMEVAIKWDTNFHFNPDTICESLYCRPAY